MKHVFGAVVVFFGILGTSGCSESTDGGNAGMDGSMDASADARALPDVFDANAAKDTGRRNDSGHESPDASDEDSGQDDAGTGAECHSTETVVERLHGLCFDDSRPCETYQVSARLFLCMRCDSRFSVLPDGTPVDKSPSFTLVGWCIPGGYVGGERVSFYYDETEFMDPAIIPGLRGQAGWKVEIARAGFEYCEECFDMQGWYPEFRFRGSLENVEFVRDLKDELEVFVEVRDAEGSLVADIR